MSKRKYDSFHAYLVKSAHFSGPWEIPELENVSDIIPSDLIPFSQINRTQNYNSWVHFYLDDYRFERLWNCPARYLNQLQKFNGIITPDFSVYCDMPLAEQIHNVYRNHALAYWLSLKGIKIIPNVRWGDERSYDFCFDGIPKNGIVSVGTNGCIAVPKCRILFEKGLAEMIHRISPHTILVYGSAPTTIFGQYIASGIQTISFPAELQKVHRLKSSSGVA